MDEPPSVLESFGGQLHRVAVDSLTVNVFRACDCVDFSVERPRLDEAADGEFSFRHRVAVRQVVSGRHVAEVVCHGLCVGLEDFLSVLEEQQQVDAVVLPVVVEAVGLVRVGFEAVGLAVPPYFDF